MLFLQTLIRFDLCKSFIPPPKLTASGVLSLLRDLESIIRYRLQLHELVPIQLSHKGYQIRVSKQRHLRLCARLTSVIDDGRVTFTCPGAFKASFTLGGDEDYDQWYLVNFSFDFQGNGGRHSNVRGRM